MKTEEIRTAALDPFQIEMRRHLAKFTSNIFYLVGEELEVTGHLFGSDKQSGLSPFGHGKDATVAVSMLLQIGSQLVSASADLYKDGRHYAASALVRQLVEVEYLAWAFEANNEESSRWLRSTHDERKNFFSPAKLRKAAGEHFRSLDYSYHCELGGHPVPGSWILLNGDEAYAQLMLSDCLGHSGRIWDHLVGWARQNTHGSAILLKSKEMSENYFNWKKVDQLLNLPAPPDFPDRW